MTNKVETPASDSAEPTSMKDPEVSGAVDELLGGNDDRPTVSTPKPPIIKSHWVNQVFDETYLRLAEHRSSHRLEVELNFISDQLGLQDRDGQLIDIACGGGQYAVELKRRGVDVVGLDQSRLALAWAKHRAEKSKVSLKFICADMRRLDFEKMFSSALIWGNSLGYFGREGDTETFESVARLLRPGGRVLFETLNRDFIRRELPHRNWWESDSLLVLEEVSFVEKTSQINVYRAISEKDEDKTYNREFRMRVYSLHELEQIVQQAGLAVTVVSGDMHHPGYFLGTNHRRMFVVAEKPG